MDYRIRKLEESEYKILEDFLYEAIYLPEGADLPDKSIIELPELKIYIEHFGRRGDQALVAESKGKIIGAVWTRFIKDYGYIDNETPSLSISLYKQYRGLGVGTRLMKDMLHLLKTLGYKKVSLSVQKENDAAKLYLNLGFSIVRENESDYVMVYKFD